MAKEDENFLRASLLLLKGGSFVSKETLQIEVNKSGKTIDDLLKPFEKKLYHKTVKRQRDKLFPQGGTGTNIEVWDIAMLVTVLLTVFKNSLDDDQKDHLKTIKTIRDGVYAHSSSSSLSNDDYDDIRQRLEQAYLSLSSSIGNDKTDECYDIIQKCTADPINPEELKKQLENQEDLFQVVINKLIDHKQSLLEMRDEIMAKLDSICKTEDRSTRTITVVDTKLTLSGAINEKADIDFADDILTKVLNEAIKRAGGDKNYTKIRKVVDKMLEDIRNLPDVEVQHAEPKCIILKFKCCSYLGLQTILEYLHSDTFKNSLKELAISLNSIEKLKSEHINIDAEVTLECLKIILDTLMRRPTRKREITGRLYDQDDGQKQNKRQTQISPTRPRTPSAPLRAPTMLSMSPSLVTQLPTPPTPPRAPTPPPMDHTLPPRVLDQNLQLTNEQDNAIRSKDSQEDGILDGIELTDLLLKQGRKSREVFRECQKICQVIKDESEHIAHVEAAYRFGDDKNVIFLVFATKQIKIDLIWVIEIRIINSYSDESRVMLHCKENSPLTEKESQKLGEIIDMHSKKLMCDHKFLSAISASSVLSRHFGSMRYKHKIEKRPCIVLNVLDKGIIPLNEEYFPTELDGIPVDVREGGVRLCVNIAEQYQIKATIGCKITSSTCPEKAGTLGGFIEHPEYGLCGITCAHVVLNDDDKSKLKEMSTCTVKEKLKGMIYQPDGFISENRLGQLVHVTYKEGENGKPGVDLALFKIEKRAPKKGRFPDSKLQSFDTGLVWGKAGIPDGQREVQKFGYVTLKTTGELEFDNCAIKEVPFHNKMTLEDGTPLTTTLYKQYHIKSSDVNIPFCEQGDSGALVFMEDNTGGEPNLRCIGMLVAVMPGNSACVIPINAILDELNVKQLKPFTNTQFDEISGMLRSIDARLKNLEERMSPI